MKVFILIFLLNGFLCGITFGQKPDTLVFTNPEIEPNFQYDTCTSIISSVRNYFREKYKMPTVLLDNGYTGRIIVEFIIERDSSLSNVKLIRVIHEPLDKSIIEAIKAMPKWIPGINNGKSVRTRLVIPISIRWLYGKIDEYKQ